MPQEKIANELGPRNRHLDTEHEQKGVKVLKKGEHIPDSDKRHKLLHQSSVNLTMDHIREMANKANQPKEAKGRPAPTNDDAFLDELEESQPPPSKPLEKKHGKLEALPEKLAVSKLQGVACAVVFFHSPDFMQSRVMKERLRTVASRFPETLFIELDAKSSNFLPMRFKIKTLPTLCLLKDGNLIEKILGFDNIHRGAECSPLDIARRLKHFQMIQDAFDSDDDLLCVGERDKLVEDED